jgi:1-deoxy-D-xylulose-5-phosphate synthase
MRALEVAEQLQQDSIGVSVLHVPTIKPLDEEKLAVIFKEHKIIITVEEGVINGGLGSSINNFAIKNNLKNKIINRGVSDVFIEHGTVKQLLELTELDTKSLSKFLTKIYYD